MKKLLLASLAVAALAALPAASPADAADLHVKAPRAVAVAPACAQFGGSYIGANVGGAYHDTHWTDRDNWIDNFNFDFNSSSPSTTRFGVTVGGQAGYNWQRGCVLFGVVVDGSWTSLRGDKDYTPVAGPGTVLTIRDSVDWWASLRTRTGIIVQDVMLYATGGVAFAGIKHNWSINDATIVGPLCCESFSAKRFRWGGVAGFGVEWAWSDRVSITSEALYVHFAEDRTSGFSAAGAQTVRFDSRDSMFITRVGLNYRWGAPVVARY